jgi:hypothetical protein
MRLRLRHKITILLFYFLESVVTLMPRGWGEWYAADDDVYGASGVCAVLQYGVCAALLLTGLISFMQTSMAGLGVAAVARSQEEALAEVQYHAGFACSE